MIAFWIATALLAAATAAFVVLRAARAETKGQADEDPALAVYRRQLSEIDDLSERGLVPADEYRSTRAEAARRLLAAADRSAAPGLSKRTSRTLVVAAAAVAPLLGLGLYLLVGSPQTPDQPFAKRLAAWGKTDPQSLDPAQMAAVLQAFTTQHPNEAQAFYFLARVQFSMGDAFSAERNLRKAIALAPTRADLWAALGETLTAPNGDEVSDEARKAFAQANALDPASPTPRYYLARAQIAGGEAAKGLAAWRALAHDLPPGDPRGAVLAQEIAAVEKTGALPAAQPQAPSGADTQAFIQSMVAGLAARLEAKPDDPAGWGRLIHAYAVLGDEPHRAAAQARARQLFHDRPDALRVVDAASAGPK